MMSAKSENFRIIRFMVVVSVCCATMLSMISLALKGPQKKAIQLDMQKQMLVACRLLTTDGYLVEKNGGGRASSDEISSVYKRCIKAFLVDDYGERFSFEDLGIDEEKYMQENSKRGFADLPFKVVYEIFSSQGEGSENTIGYIVPINGFGLWDAIYGYIAIKTDGDEILGTAWYKHAETPGLGAIIALPEWQEQFVGKKVFNIDGDAPIDVSKVPVRLALVKGKVEDLNLSQEKAKTSVDGLPGATLTSQGVTKAYQDCLDKYKNFLIKLHSL